MAEKIKNLPGDLGSSPAVGKISWRREWQPTLVFLPGEFHEQRSLAGYSPCGGKKSDTTKLLTYTKHDLYSLQRKSHFKSL